VKGIVTDDSELFESAEHRPAFIVGGAAVVVGLCLAAWASWTCDDAFISFRYARNLVEGHGLVFNLGERVEGYTNLLWTLWIAVGLRLGVGAEPWSGVFGLLSYGGSLALLGVPGRSRTPGLEVVRDERPGDLGLHGRRAHRIRHAG